MTKNATEVLDTAEAEQSRIYDHIRDAADWFHDHEGEMFERDEARDRLADDINVDDDVAQSLIAELVGDTVDPIVQARANGIKYVGVAEFKEFEGAYGYLDYDDVMGKRKRVVCQQCVNEAEYDNQVTHATAGDPNGTFGSNDSYSDLLEGVHDHYEDAHSVIPSEVKTGASLASGTTIGGNTSWHAGNDGGSSGLDADTVDGNHANQIGNWNQITSFSDSDTSTAVSWDTGTLSTTYHLYKIQVQIESQTTNQNYGIVNVNGDTSSNYNRLDINGNQSFNLVNGASRWPNVGRHDGGGLWSVEAVITGDNRIVEPTNNQHPTISVESAQRPGDATMLNGILGVNYTGVDQLKYSTNAVATGRMKVYGKNL